MPCCINDSDCIPGRLRRGMCERHYRRHLKHGATSAPVFIDNFAQYRALPSGCWEWTGALWGNGYGKPSIYLHGTRLAHRAFYIEHVGPVDDGVDIDHRCHNADPTCQRGHSCPHRRCVNPEHLEPVSRQVNLTRAQRSRHRCEVGLHDLTLPDAVRPGTMQCTECWRTRYRAAGKRWREKQRGRSVS